MLLLALCIFERQICTLRKTSFDCVLSSCEAQVQDCFASQATVLVVPTWQQGEAHVIEGCVQQLSSLPGPCTWLTTRD